MVLALIAAAAWGAATWLVFEGSSRDSREWAIVMLVIPAFAIAMKIAEMIDKMKGSDG